MSLINDALKRASKWDKDRPPQASLPRPMHPAPAENRPQNPLLGVLIFIAVAALMFGGFFFWKWWEASHSATVAPPIQTDRTVIVQKPPTATLVPVSIPKIAPVVQQTPTPALSIAPAAAPLAPANAIVVPQAPPKPAFPALTLKAIFYNKTSPRALVSGKTVEPGDQIDGALIKSIEQDRVVVTWHGETKDLLMHSPQ